MENGLIIKNKQDVINWLKWLKKEQGLTTEKCLIVNYKDLQKHAKCSPEVFVDDVIRKRYQGMIDYLESDEVR